MRVERVNNELRLWMTEEEYESLFQALQPNERWGYGNLAKSGYDTLILPRQPACIAIREESPPTTNPEEVSGT